MYFISKTVFSEGYWYLKMALFGVLRGILAHI
jgi:hypothetical protein